MSSSSFATMNLHFSLAISVHSLHLVKASILELLHLQPVHRTKFGYDTQIHRLSVLRCATVCLVKWHVVGPSADPLVTVSCSHGFRPKPTYG